MASFDKAHDVVTGVVGQHIPAGFYSADYSQAAANVLVKEGAYQNNPDDNGNWTGGKKGVGVLVGTNYGISAPAWQRYHGKQPTEANMRAITPAEAKKIYRALFWDYVRGSEIKNQAVAEIIFDAFVNQTGKTDEMVRDTLAALGKPVVVTLSSAKPLNDEAVHAINEADSQKFFEEFKNQRLKWYEDLAKKNTQLAGFLQGWKNRLSQFTFSFTDSVKKKWREKPLLIAAAALVFTSMIIGIIAIASTGKKSNE